MIKRLTAYKEILDEVITIASVERAIRDVAHTGTYIPSPKIIIRETARYYSLKEEDLRGQNRSKNTALARQVSMYLMRSLTNLSLKDIGAEYEDRNHATVLASIRKVEDLMQKDPTTMSGRHSGYHLEHLLQQRRTEFFHISKWKSFRSEPCGKDFQPAGCGKLKNSQTFL